MSLEELDSIICSMEKNLDEIKNYQVIYKELSELQGNISQSVEDLKTNKEALDNLNIGITTSIENLKKQVEGLNTLLPQKMVEIVASNKDIQLDIKNKHEDLIKLSNKNMDTIINTNEHFSHTIQKQFKSFIVLCIFVFISFIINIIFICKLFIK